ncbi:hypothetical protein GCM10009555_031900 [Acrocarpospora macrocephala]|uniref:DUF1963 domain-containing protein n=1 Tax=Acrocarpospora macrocephala TaxID=150177 RepID=A0A5M3WYX0_9ACTN|nr:YwqG family protein [Acrocarpospora macrocephala]GES12521.1 hypothetical protein Amac_061180 [Acrocarpospora macrocephala]
MTDWRSDFAEFARGNLPVQSAERMIGLLRPAVRLYAAASGEVVVGRLGGAARLPENMAWPLDAGGGPLSLVAEFDCGRLARHPVDIALPRCGTLLFFIAAESGKNQVIYLPPGTAVAERHPPGHDRARVYAEVPLAAVTEPSWPDLGHPAVLDAFGSLDAARELVWDHVADQDPEDAEDEDVGDGETFAWELTLYHERRMRPGPPHQMGGYSDTLQNPVEVAAAHAAGAGWYGDPAFQEEARQWVTLLQVADDSRAQMIWGDGAYLIWGIRKDHLAALDFSKVYLYISGH